MAWKTTGPGVLITRAHTGTNEILPDLAGPKAAQSELQSQNQELLDNKRTGKTHLPFLTHLFNIFFCHIKYHYIGSILYSHKLSQKSYYLRHSWVKDGNN